MTEKTHQKSQHQQAQARPEAFSRRSKEKEKVSKLTTPLNKTPKLPLLSILELQAIFKKFS